MGDLLLAAGEAEQVERVTDDGEDDGHGGEVALELFRLGPVSGDLRSDHHDEHQYAEDGPHRVPDAKA